MKITTKACLWLFGSKVVPFGSGDNGLNLLLHLGLTSILLHGLAAPALAMSSDANAQSGPQQANLLDLPEARVYMLSLINRDRKQHGAPPVELDDIGNKAAQFHADQMAEKNFNGHWHPNGQKPPQRYNDLGGLDYVGENSHGSGYDAPFSGAPSEKQLFSKDDLEKEESIYFDEKPPNDGHRKNILDPAHTHVGLGLRLVEVKYEGESSGTNVASAQEFISRYGKYTIGERTFKKGQPFLIDGELDQGVKFYDIDVLREDLPEPIPLLQLQSSEGEHHGGYTLANEHIASIFPPPFVASPDGSVRADQNRFHAEILPGHHWKRGLYYIIIWVKKGGNPLPVSLITVPLE